VGSVWLAALQLSKRWFVQTQRQYLKANGVQQSIDEGMKWYRRAADQGLAIAQFNLGFGYASGQGVPQNDVMAHMWFNLSAAQGSHDAARNLDTIEQIMTPAQIAEAQKLAREWRPKPQQLNRASTTGPKMAVPFGAS
jgi:uncharacterized protein